MPTLLNLQNNLNDALIIAFGTQMLVFTINSAQILTITEP